MPRAYRPMKAEGEPPRPVIGDSATKLGVRERDLFSPGMVPQRLNDLGLVPGAMGPNTLHLFRIGDGSFELASLTDRLMLVPDHDDHGTVQPAAVMPYREFKQAIHDTRDQWVSGEGEDDR